MASYEIDPAAGTLKVSGTLLGEDETHLRQECDELLRGPAKTMTIDLKEVESITSMCIGIIAALWLDAITIERGLVVKPSKEVRRVFQLAGFDRVFKLADE